MEVIPDILKKSKVAKTDNYVNEFSTFLFKLLFGEQNICSAEIIPQVENSICKLFNVFQLKLNEKAIHSIYYKLFCWISKTPSYQNQNILFYRFVLDNNANVIFLNYMFHDPNQFSGY